MLYTQAVQRAALALDDDRGQHRSRSPMMMEPWEHSVTLPLDLTTAYSCVLGQIYGSFSVGRSQLSLDEPRNAQLRAAFGIGVNAVQRALITSAWRRELRRRRRALEVSSDDTT